MLQQARNYYRLVRDFFLNRNFRRLYRFCGVSDCGTASHRGENGTGDVVLGGRTQMVY